MISKNLAKRTMVKDNAALYKIGCVKAFELQNCIAIPVKDISSCFSLVFYTFLLDLLTHPSPKKQNIYTCFCLFRV